MKSPYKRQGFTLLEVVISVAILAVLSFYTAQTIQSGLQSKAKIQKHIDRDSRLRDALKVMSNDIQQVFNFHDINIELYNLAQDERKKAALQAQKDKSKNKNMGNYKPKYN